MQLDDPADFARLDSHNMLAQIDALPAQLQAGWDLGLTSPLPAWETPSQVIIAGMGGSAIAGDLLVAWVAPHCRIPVFIHRDYGLPAWAADTHTLLVACSHSGDTEETLHALETGLERGCRLLAVTTGGALARRAGQVQAPCWKFEHAGQPRSAVGYTFGLLLAAFTRLGLIADPTPELASAIQSMRAQQPALAPEVSASLNPAKRLAGQLVGRWINVIASGFLAPVARRWKGQLNELAKTGAGFDLLPEADHNSLAGLTHPEAALSRIATVFLRAQGEHPRNLLRSQLTQKTYMLEGHNTNDFSAPGETTLAQQWSALHFGDYLAYYLALAYGIDPTPIEIIHEFKQRLG